MELFQPLVAPLCTGHWRGSLDVRPWYYRVCCLVPHLETPDILEASLPLLLHQDACPYVLVIDTGSSPATLARLESLRFHAPDGRLEVHHLRSHGWPNSSSPVAAALDVGLALCRSPYLYLTHVDVFHHRRDWLSHLTTLCRPSTPAVGYAMVERPHGSLYYLGHTATMLYMPTMWRIGLTFSIERAMMLLGRWPCSVSGGWPDTETAFNMVMEHAGVLPTLIGEERHPYHLDESIEHVRNAPHGRVYPQLALSDAESRLAAAIANAKGTLARWSMTAAAPPKQFACGHSFRQPDDDMREEDVRFLASSPCPTCLRDRTWESLHSA